MKITILDGNALNPGDLSWEPIEKLGSLKVYPRTMPEDVVLRISDSDVVLLNKIDITEDVLSKCPKLKYIGVQATGYNVIDIEACIKRNIVVTNVPSYSTASVAQMAFAYILEFASKPTLHSKSVKQGDWTKSLDFCYWNSPLIELEGKTLGIFGFGSIGQRVAKIAKSFGMKTIVHTRTKKNDIENLVDFDTLLKESDFISLHAPLTEKTREIFNKDAISKMKKSAYLINTARGLLVQEEDLSKALNDGLIAGYATDVVSEEPMKESNPLIKAKNTIITPHIAWAAVETRQRLLNIVADNLKSWLNGKPQNVVS